MGPLMYCRSLVQHLTRLSIIGAVPALLLVLTNGTLYLVHPAGPPKAPTVSMGGAQSEPVTPRTFEGGRRPPGSPGTPCARCLGPSLDSATSPRKPFSLHCPNHGKSL